MIMGAMKEKQEREWDSLVSGCKILKRLAPEKAIFEQTSEVRWGNKFY